MTSTTASEGQRGLKVKVTVQLQVRELKVSVRGATISGFRHFVDVASVETATGSAVRAGPAATTKTAIYLPKRILKTHTHT